MNKIKHLEDNGIYYLAKEASQFTTIRSLWEKIGGTFLTWDVTRGRFRKKWPPEWFDVNVFPHKRNLSDFFQQLEFLFPDCDYSKVRHFYSGPFPEKTKSLICTSMWPILPKSERNFTTFQFYHGVGDKRYKVGTENEYPPMFDHWDYWMLPGEKDCQKLLYHSKIAGITLRDEQIVKIGYLRFDKFINGDYNVTELKKLAGIPDNGRKNILFSPTWRWGGGTLMSHYKTFCDLIPQKYNFIIRNHINDANKISEIREYCQEKKIQNVYFLNDTIMNFNDNMMFVDLLISDSSSVLYDFLITGKPIIFNKISSPNVMKSEYKFDIKRCGFEFSIESQNILNVIEKSLTTDIFQSHIDEVRLNCFYFLDGKSTERAIDFINSVVKKE